MSNTPGRQQSKRPRLSGNADKKSIETVFLIAICHHFGDKWQWKTLFLSIFDPRLSIVDNVFHCRPTRCKQTVVWTHSFLKWNGFTHSAVCSSGMECVHTAICSSITFKPDLCPKVFFCNFSHKHPPLFMLYSPGL